MLVIIAYSSIHYHYIAILWIRTNYVWCEILLDSKYNFWRVGATESFNRPGALAYSVYYNNLLFCWRISMSDCYSSLFITIISTYCVIFDVVNRNYIWCEIVLDSIYNFYKEGATESSSIDQEFWHIPFIIITYWNYFASVFLRAIVILAYSSIPHHYITILCNLWCH